MCLTRNSLDWLWMDWAHNLDKHQIICESLRHFWIMIKHVKVWREPISIAFEPQSTSFERLILIDFESIYAIPTFNETARCFSLFYLYSLKVNFQNVCVLCIWRAGRWFLRLESRIDFESEFPNLQGIYIYTESWVS